MKKLWLDDVRTPPNDTWIVAKTAQEAIDILTYEDIGFASLDHDLADGHYPWNAGVPYPDNGELVRATKEMTGYDVVCFMEANNIWPKYGVRVHSQNPVGVERMQKVIAKAGYLHHGSFLQ